MASLALVSSLTSCSAVASLKSVPAKSCSSPCSKSTSLSARASASTESSDASLPAAIVLTRRTAALAALAIASSSLSALPARADFAETYTLDTQTVIDQVRATLSLDKTDPRKDESVTALRSLSNDWVAKYRREKSVAGKPSFSNMYSVVNAISGHYISFGSGYPIPKKRADRILEEVSDAERALKRGR